VPRRAPDGVTMLQRGLSVLSSFDARHPRLTITQMARRTGLPLSTTFRLVQQLESWGGLIRVDEHMYAIGTRIWDLGLLSNLHRELRHVAVPYLRDVFATTKQNVHLAVRDGTATLFVERLSDSETSPLVSSAGSRLPLNATGVGKAILAYSSSDLVAQVIADATAFTAYTIIDAQHLQRQLADVRRRGFARTSQELSLGASSIGVPILDGEGHAVAAIGIVGRSPKQDITRLVPVLQMAARAIARRLDPTADSAYERADG
jgi:DNA-binding IclR family transcriptional regulator